jgi:hypothetical protein
MNENLPVITNAALSADNNSHEKHIIHRRKKKQKKKTWRQFIAL